MAIVDSNHDQDLSHMNQLWSLISELSEQLSQNRSLAVSLYSQADVVNVCFTISTSDLRLRVYEFGHY